MVQVDRRESIRSPKYSAEEVLSFLGKETQCDVPVPHRSVGDRFVWDVAGSSRVDSTAKKFAGRQVPSLFVK